MLGPEYILENYLQVTDNYSVEEESDEELALADAESETEDPTFDPLPKVERAQASSDSDQSSLTSSESDSERTIDGSSEFWDSRSSDGEDYLMSEPGEGDLSHQSNDLEMSNEDDTKKRMFQSEEDQTEEDHKRPKLDFNDSSPDIDDDEISFSDDESCEGKAQDGLFNEDICVAAEVA